MFDDDDAGHEPRPHELSPDVQALINNGLEFLDKAREELEASKAKFSVVSFWTAVEILLKVPLVHEHWSLVCSKKTTPKKQAYRNGDFQSITYEETRSLLRDVLEKPLPPDTHNAFEKVRKHRNRVVHFYHSAFTYADQEQIQKEQADAWFALNRFMRDQWLSIFDEPLTLKRALDEDGMLRNSLFYADAKFRYLKPELDGLKKQGCSVSACRFCSKEAAVDMRLNEESGNTLHESDCLVCGTRSDQYLEVTCPHCGIKQNLYATGETEFTCLQCNHSSSRYDLLDEWEGKPEDFSYSGLPASCSDCDSYGTVCEYGGGYLCTTCLVFHDSLETCGYCGGHSTAVPEMSGLVGCNLCDGNRWLLEE
ncbi:hsdR [Enterobacter cloacae complex sp. 2022EL-00981]|uniref:hsdR n=1 Tax=Enterobacter cloacae complex sp. 2022EL-00981 TaxID=3027862 RepID=UPI002366D4C8|nr:hsdR [Enterobacter cloacae complex sp. 2022EL-00981]MDD7872439.1 hsdR [Enterobacter cloacae complex sp. 2022EL-00981]